MRLTYKTKRRGNEQYLGGTDLLLQHMSLQCAAARCCQHTFSKAKPLGMLLILAAQDHYLRLCGEGWGRLRGKLGPALGSGKDGGGWGMLGRGGG